MGLLSANQCEGCNCLNETEAASPTTPIDSTCTTDTPNRYTPTAADWNVDTCEYGEPVPSSYALTFGCSHPWIALDSSTGNFYGSCPDFNTGQQLNGWFYRPVEELKRVCLQSQRWSNDVTDTYTREVVDCLSYLQGIYFPPYNYLPDTGAMVHYPARYVGSGRFPIAGDAVNFNVWGVTSIADDRQGWSLTVDGTDATITHLFAGQSCGGVGVRKNPFTALGKSPPVYVVVGDFTHWQRNNFRLTKESRVDWPSLVPDICLSPMKRPYRFSKPCPDGETECKCCDTLGSIRIVTTGCLKEDTAFQYTSIPTSSAWTTFVGARTWCATPPAWPTPDCHVITWSKTVCSTPATGYTGQALFFAWCIGGVYTVKVYCETDASPDCWELAQTPTVAFECECNRPKLTFKLDLPCCCAPVCCPCEGLPANLTMSDGTNTLPMSKDSDCASFPSGLYNIGSGAFCGKNFSAGTLVCNAGVWTASGNYDDASAFAVTFTWDGDCNTIVMTGVDGSCSVTITE